MKTQLSIRFKILILIIGALAISLLSYLYVGTHLIIEDKVSYIYDYTLAEVKSAADKIDSRFQKINSVGRMVSNLVRANDPVNPTPGASSPAQALFNQYSKELGITGALVLRPSDTEHFELLAHVGDAESAHYTEALALVGWTPQAFDQEPILIGIPIPVANGTPRIPVGVRATDGEGKPVAFFTLTQLDAGFLKDGGKNYEIRLVDHLGHTLLTKPSTEGTIAPEAFDAFSRALTSGTFESGVRDWNHRGKEYIAGYQRLGSKKLTVTSLISRDTAFVAAKQLVARSLVLGLSILLLATGATLLSVRTLTRKLREMWHATQKVANGDFSVRVNTQGMSKDEVGGLAHSFNVMANKIDELMIQTAEKARMEKELETAQTVQSRFFPAKPFDNAAISIAGRYVPASECAGDWWHYSQIGDQLIVVVGDVTGHGVSAALVTAAAHSAFSLLMDQFSKKPEELVSMEILISSLNSVVVAAGGHQSTMTFVASIIDLKTGQMTMTNASHPPIYIYRKPEGFGSPDNKAASNPIKCFKPLMGARIASLGENATIEVKSTLFQIHPGDRVFWYTDGIMESRPSDGAKINKPAFLKMLASHAGEANQQAVHACDSVIDEALRFFGDGDKARPDDMTLVVATVPVQSGFSNS
ncbi:SpoIIE family protein phosphatase [Bdellovibrionota bacterium FG-1]